MAAELPSRLSALHSILSKGKVAVVNIHYPSLSALHFVILRALGLYNGKIILSFHGLDIEQAQAAKGLEKKMWHQLLRSADAIVTCSHALRERVLQFAPECQRTVQAIHNGIDRELIRQRADKDFVLDAALKKGRYILNVATFEYKKGQDVLLEAFGAIASEFPDMALVFVGRSGPALAELKVRTREHRLEQRVHFYLDVPHERVWAFFERASVFCLPSRTEPFGIVVLEAGMFSLPVVASQVGGVPEIMTDGVHGHLVPPDDAAALAGKLRDTINSPDTAATYACTLRRRVADHFTWTRAFLEYENICY